MKLSVIKLLLSCFVASALLSSCASYHYGMYADVITFNDEAYASYKINGKHTASPDYKKRLLFQNMDDPYVIKGALTKFKGEKEASKLETEKNVKIEEKNNADFETLSHKIYNVTVDTGFNTAGHYALDLGLDRIKYVRKKILKRDKNTEFFIIYLTDGLDNTSLRIAKNHHQVLFANTPEKYVKKINKKKAKVMGCGKTQQRFQMFPMVFKGEDMNHIEKDMSTGNPVQDSIVFKKWMNDQMSPFIGASKNWQAPDLLMSDDWDELQANFQDVFEASAYYFYAPKGYQNKNIRMVLTNEDQTAEATIEGTYTKKLGKYYLKDIRLQGKDSNGNDIQLVADDKDGKSSSYIALKPAYNSSFFDRKSPESWFTLSNLKYTDNRTSQVKRFKPYLSANPQNKDMNPKQYYMEGRAPIYNSEYKGNKVPTLNKYFLFVTDGSNSLAGQRCGQVDMLWSLVEYIVDQDKNKVGDKMIVKQDLRSRFCARCQDELKRNGKESEFCKKQSQSTEKNDQGKTPQKQTKGKSTGKK